jgi:3-phytase/alkaline phosphatase D
MPTPTPSRFETVYAVAPAFETNPPLLDDPELSTPEQADADDPAIWVNPNDPNQSLIITAVKNAGLRVYDLEGNLLQEINPGLEGSESDVARYNNVDLLYGFEFDGAVIDLVVFTDRNNDTLTVYRINPNPQPFGNDSSYLENITDGDLGTLFQTAPFEPPYEVDSRSAYGIALYTSPVSGDSFAFVNRRETGDVVQLRLFDTGFGTIAVEPVRNFTVPIPAGAPADTDPQLEGMVVDQETGFLYIGQENVGIWKYYAEPGSSNVGKLIDTVQDLGGKVLTDDVEGLTIYYGANGTGYLLASSQGDNSFAVYSREGNNDFLGRFEVTANGAIDAVQESDGADVINVPLGNNFPFGLFVTQDGSNDPAVLVEDDGELENISTNFKLVPYETIANAFPNPLQIDTTSYDPRNPVAQSLLNGVGSGDTTQTSTVLWTRSNFVGDVLFEYSTTADFSQIVGSKTATVTNPMQPVKVNIDGLNANTTYFYRATDAAGATAIGKLETAAPIGTRTGLRFGATGDWQQAPPFPSLSNADQRNLEFFLKLGDTIYADTETPALPGVTQARTLEQFRIKQEENVSTRFGLNTLRDLYATTSILATIDDHELVDNFAGGAAPGVSPDAPDIGSSPDPLFTDAVAFVNDTQAYEDALQAFQEYHPIRNDFYGETGDARTAGERKLYRANTYGSDAALFVLDTRSFRDVQLAPANLANPLPFLVNAFDLSRTLLGQQQFADLKRDLLAAQENGVTWKFIAVPEPIQNFGVINAEDRFEGYAAERTQLLKFITDNQIENVVFMSGDFHGTLVNNLTYQLAPGQPQIQTGAFEVVMGPAAFFDGLFGPTVAQLSLAAGLLTPEQFAFYNQLPIAPDADSFLNDKDDLIKQVLVAQTNAFGYDPIGLQGSPINATLLQGDYLSTHTYGWTEYDIDQASQTLKVTTYGIPFYSEAQLLADPAAITSQTPTVVSQFEVKIATPNAGNKTIAVAAGETRTIRNFGGVGTGNQPSAATIAEADTLQFTGAGLTVENLLLTQVGNNLELTFAGVANTKVTLTNFQLENFDNLLTGTGASATVGNILFNGETELVDSIDVFDADETSRRLENPNNVTFLNDLDNDVRGFDNFGDVINGQGGDDTIRGLSGNDLLRGGDGNDRLFGGADDDILVGGNGIDTLTGGGGDDTFIIAIGTGTDTITDFNRRRDTIGLANGLTFGQLTLASDNGDTLISLTSNNELLAILTGVRTATLNSSNFTVI